MGFKVSLINEPTCVSSYLSCKFILLSKQQIILSGQSEDDVNFISIKDSNFRSAVESKSVNFNFFLYKDGPHVMHTFP